MTYDNQLTLISQTYTTDDIGNQMAVETKTNILCGLKSIGRNEFYSASQVGLKPTIIFTIHAYEYNDEILIEFESKQYSVLKTYSINFEDLELTCKRVVANG